MSASPLLLHYADQVAFMQNSKITAVGTHESLLVDDEAYRQVVMRTLEDVDV